MLAAKKGCVPLCEWLGGHFRVMWCDILAADRSVVVEACCCEAHYSSFLVCALGFALCGSAVLNFAKILRGPCRRRSSFVTPHCHVEPEPMFTCQFCWRPSVSWRPHMLYKCPSAVSEASYVFASALALLPCNGRVWHLSHQCTVCCGHRVVVSALAHQSCLRGPRQSSPCPNVCLSPSLVWCTLRGTPR